MIAPTINPYEEIGTFFKDGLDYLVAHPPAGDWTISYINETLITFLDEEDADNNFGKLIASIFPNSVNDWTNLKIAANLKANSGQMALIEAILESIKENTIDSLDTTWYQSANEQIALSDIDTIDKAPLYIALAITSSSLSYWNDIVTTPGSWATFLSSNAAINYAKIPAWASASFVGSLSGFAQVKDIDITQTSDLTSVFFGVLGEAGSFMSATGLTAAMVIMKLGKRPVAECGCNG
ncbi:MAG: hypothetical protein ACO1G5_00875 [Bacteroidota bacterium]